MSLAVPPTRGDFATAEYGAFSDDGSVRFAFASCEEIDTET